MEGQRLSSHARYGNSSTPANWSPSYSANRERIGEILLGLRKVQPERVPGRAELLGREETFDEGETVTTYCLRGGRRRPARALILTTRRGTLVSRRPRRGAPTLTDVRAVQFDMADPQFPASLVELPEPELPGASWARVEVSRRRHLRERSPPVRPQRGAVAHARLDGLDPVPPGSRDRRPGDRGRTRRPRSPSAPGWPSTRASPALLGGSTLLARTVHAGWTSSCLNLDSRVLSRGARSGTRRASAAGGRDQVLAHHSMLHPHSGHGARLAGLSARAGLDRVATGCCAHRPTDGEPVLVVGAGIIGLASVAAVKGLFPGCPVTVLARHPFQAEAARRCGADHVVHDPTRQRALRRARRPWSARGSSVTRRTSC